MTYFDLEKATDSELKQIVMDYTFFINSDLGDSFTRDVVNNTNKELGMSNITIDQVFKEAFRVISYKFANIK